MVKVKLWGSLRAFADGQEWVEVEASNFKQLLDQLSQKHPALIPQIKRGVSLAVDGVIYRGRLSDLKPKDINSVNVLKDPSSKAIYGAQAANGIVIVSTKSGKTTHEPTINYSTFYSMQTPVNARITADRQIYLKAVKIILFRYYFQNTFQSLV